jgi:polyisoprenoid-binding protein YceI
MTSITVPIAPNPTALSTWNIDPIHSAIEFKVRHMVISYVRGEFTRVSGVLSWTNLTTLAPH